MGFVELVFEFGISFREDSSKGVLVLETGEVEGLLGVEDDRFLGKVAVVGVVETICAEALREVGWRESAYHDLDNPTLDGHGTHRL